MPTRYPTTVSLILVLALATGGCASYRANRADVAEQIEAMVAANEYSRALATIDLVKADHPDYRRLRTWRTTIEKNSRTWEAEIVEESEQMMDAGQWHNAGKRLTESLAKLPQSEPLQRTQERFRQRRDAYVAVVELELALARGRGLPAEMAALQKLADVDPDESELRDMIEQRAALLERSRQRLLECGRSELAARRTAAAIECLTAAQNIAADDETRELLASARTTQEARKSQTLAAEQKREQNDQERRIAQLGTAYRTALRNGDLGGARKRLDELLAVQPSAELRQERTQLDARIQRRVKQGFEEGNRLYTQGDFEGARAQWSGALRLDPDNEELRNNIARAERVLKKLETLSSDQQQSDDQQNATQ